MATDDYSTLSGQSSAAPASHAAAVVPDDSNDLTDVTRWVYVGGTGDLVVVMSDGAIATFTGVPAGTLLPIRVSRVKATGTTAGEISALW